MGRTAGPGGGAAARSDPACRGEGAWLAPLAAAPLVLVSGWLLGRLSGGRGLAFAFCERLGRAGGNLLLIIYIVWAELLLAIRLRACAQRLLASGYRDGSLIFFLAALALMALWMGTGRLAPFARAAQLFWWSFWGRRPWS